VLGCKYHGWSYDVKGHLVKAPMFDGVPGFRKEENSLFEVPVRVIESSGVVFINLDVARMEEGENDIVENKETVLVDRFLDLDKNKSRWLDGRTVEGGFNWKHAGKWEGSFSQDLDLPNLYNA
jgi:phenylpropionate dioxygenase-like ring-hydroxylating dioxygenase large terminal subunit